jgi:hypothetical protein
MTNEQILQQIATLEKGLTNPSVPEASKAKMRDRVDSLKSQLEEAGKKAEKVEEKIEKEEKKIQSDVEKTIETLKKGLSNPNVPEASKEKMRQRIKEAEAQMQAQKKEIKEDKKEAEQEKKEVKKAVEKLEKTARKVRAVKVPKDKAKPSKPAAPIKKEATEAAKKVKIKEKVRKVKSERRKKKLKTIMTSLEKLILKNKRLKEVYKGKGVDIKRDAARSSKPVGYRFKGEQDYRKPTPEQVQKGLKRGTVYKETRPNRGDVFPKGYKGTIKGLKGEKLEQGGMMAKGGMEKGGKEMAKGGIMKSLLKKESYQSKYANRGASWTLDHNQHNKKEDYEVPANKRKRY